MTSPTQPERQVPEYVYAKLEGWITFDGRDILLREDEPWLFLDPVVQRFGGWYFKLKPGNANE